MTASVDDLVSWQIRLRAACINSLKPDDMQEIVVHQVKKAKKGDADAIKFVMALLSGNEVRVTNNIITDPETAARMARSETKRIS